MKWIYAIVFVLLLITIPTFVISTIAFFAPKPTDIKGCLETKMNKLHLCPESDTYVRLNDISEHAKTTIMLSEDAGFYGHSGFDWYEIKESFKTNFNSLKFLRGGSTITQQLAKNVYLSGKKSLGRKIQEAFVAKQIENILSKDEIYERYLNIIELGKDIYGVKSAASFYFNKPPSELNLLESAFLAYLLPSPIKYSEVYEEGELTEFAEKRIRGILDLLLRFKKIDEETHEYANNLVPLFPWLHLNETEKILLMSNDQFSAHTSSGDIGEDNSEDDEIGETNN